MKHYIFTAMGSHDSKVSAIKKVISDCDSQEHAEKLGVAMYCRAGDVVLSCQEATVDSLVHFIRDEEIRMNGVIHQAISDGILSVTGPMEKPKSQLKRKRKSS